jgi:hypothetical protein
MALRKRGYASKAEKRRFSGGNLGYSVQSPRSTKVIISTPKRGRKLFAMAINEQSKTLRKRVGSAMAYASKKTGAFQTR